MRKRMLHRNYFFADAHLNAQFFAAFARDTFRQTLTRFHFAAGKFPQSAE